MRCQSECHLQKSFTQGKRTLSASAKSRPVPLPFPLPSGRPIGNPTFTAKYFSGLLPEPPQMLSKSEVEATSVYIGSGFASYRYAASLRSAAELHDKATALRSASRAGITTGLLSSAALRPSPAPRARCTPLRCAHRPQDVPGVLRVTAPLIKLTCGGRWFSGIQAYKPRAGQERH